MSDRIYENEEDYKKDLIKEMIESGDIVMPEGLKGDDYVLTEEDKKEIAYSIEVPVVEKIIERIEVRPTERVIEKTEVIREIPIVTEVIKEVAMYQTAEEIRNNLEALVDDERLKINAIHNLREELDKNKRENKEHVVSTSNRGLYQLLDVNVSGITTNQSIKWNGSQWIPYTASSGGTWGSITGTLSNQTDLQTALNTKWNTDGSSGAATGNWDLGLAIITDSSFVPAISIDNRSLKDSSDNTTIAWGNKGLMASGVTTVDWGGAQLNDTGGVGAFNWGSRTMYNSLGRKIYDGELNYMYAFNVTNHVVIDIATQRLLDISDQASIHWTNRELYASDGGTILANYANVTGMRFRSKIFVGSSLTTAPVSAIHVDSGSAIASELRFTAGTTTGQTTADGFQVGITTTGIAEIRQRENLDLNLYTNNTLQTVLSSTGNLGIGTGATVSAKLHTISTTEQMRVGYNTSNYFSTTLNSTGSATFDLVGTAPEFYFSDPVNVPYEIYSAGWNGNFEVPTKDAVYDQIEVKANLASPTFTGTPTLPTGTIAVTQTAGNNTTAVATTAFVTAINNNSSYRTILQASGSHTAARVAGTYGMSVANPIAISGTGTLYPLAVIQIVSADYPTVNGITTKLRIRAQLYTNDVAPTGNYTFGLYPITRPATSGGAGLAIYTLGTVVTGSNGATFTAPAVDLLGSAVGADFAIPADGAYVIGIVTTATVVASAHVHVNAQLQMRNT